MSTIKQEIRDVLLNNILPFWKSMRDDEYGGYYGYKSYDLVLDKEAEKGCILNSRILWTFSNAYMALKEEELLSYAKHAFLFLKEHFYDRERGGVYWSVTYKGEPLDTIKHSYNMAFAIYALSSYYDVTKDEEVLSLAKELFALVEKNYKDSYGYKEALTIDFQPQSNEHLSENGVMAEKTMNTMLHLYEAYTELYRVSGYEPAAEQMRFILSIFKEKMYRPSKHRLEVFFDSEMNSLIDLHSYGHDIETAWLLERGLEVLKDEKLHASMAEFLSDLEHEILKVAFDGESVAAECEGGKVLQTRIWWVQCESIIGFYNAYQKRGEQEFLDAVSAIWNYTKTYFVDERAGSEWLNERFYDKSINEELPVASPWKCPYHNARMCFEMMRRLPD